MHRKSPELTFCLISCGEKTESECVQAIAPFRDQVDFVEVRDTYPQIAALQKMSDLTNTEFLIPLDADIILNADAWDRIRIALDKHRKNERWHSILFPLHDTLTDRKILALKLLRTVALKSVPFEQGATPDIGHFKRLTDAGWTCIDSYLDKPPIGRHIVRGRHFCYHKYRDVYVTYRTHGWEWDGGLFLGGRDLRERSKAHFDYFLSRYLVTDDEDFLSCIAGMVDGITTEELGVSKTLERKPYKVKNKLAIDEYLRWYMLGTYEEAITYFLGGPVEPSAVCLGHATLRGLTPDLTQRVLNELLPTLSLIEVHHLLCGIRDRDGVGDQIERAVHFLHGVLPVSPDVPRPRLVLVDDVADDLVAIRVQYWFVCARRGVRKVQDILCDVGLDHRLRHVILDDVVKGDLILLGILFDDLLPLEELDGFRVPTQQFLLWHDDVLIVISGQEAMLFVPLEDVTIATHLPKLILLLVVGGIDTDGQGWGVNRVEADVGRVHTTDAGVATAAIGTITAGTSSGTSFHEILFEVHLTLI